MWCGNHGRGDALPLETQTVAVPDPDQAPLQCKPFPSVIMWLSVLFTSNWWLPLGHGPALRFSDRERVSVHSPPPPVPNSIIAFSYVNMTAMDKDRRKWTFCLASALCIKPLSSGAPLAPVTHFKTDLLVPTPLGPRLEEEHVCFYLVCVLPLPQKMLTKGNLLSCWF